MRAALALPFTTLMALVFLSSSVLAGDVTVANGQVTWKPTKCATPALPPALTSADRETAANDMNVMVTEYNEYVKKMQVYMSCMSDEANGDANLVSQAVINSAQASIDETQKSVETLGAEVKKKQ